MFTIADDVEPRALYSLAVQLYETRPGGGAKGAPFDEFTSSVWCGMVGEVLRVRLSRRGARFPAGVEGYLRELSQEGLADLLKDEVTSGLV